MKKLALGFSLLFCLNVMSQDVPKNIEDAFKKLYPAAADVEWTSYSSNYVSEFVVNDVYKTANFNKAGNWLQTSTSIEEESLPTAIKTLVKAKYNGSYYDSIELVENKSLSYYSITLVNEENDDYITLNLDKEGKNVPVQKNTEVDTELEEEEE